MEIFEIILAKNHEAKLRFYHGGGALPGGSSILTVSDGYGGSWKFNCKSEGGNYFSISGSGWRDFARSRINDMVTLYNEGGEYTIRVR
ncbi:hypothetical protein REPUB_Repub04eG0016000 [Reevesia pubescens]